MLLSLLAGVSRTMFAMASDGALPRALAAVHATHRVPHRAELAVGVAVAGLVLVADLRDAIGFSSFTVLAYYAVANAAAWTLPDPDRRRRRLVAAVGFGGCALLALTLPGASVAAGSAVLLAGGAVSSLRGATRRR